MLGPLYSFARRCGSSTEAIVQLLAQARSLCQAREEALHGALYDEELAQLKARLNPYPPPSTSSPQGL